MANGQNDSQISQIRVNDFYGYNGLSRWLSCGSKWLLFKEVLGKDSLPINAGLGRHIDHGEDAVYQILVRPSNPFQGQ